MSRSSARSAAAFNPDPTTELITQEPAMHKTPQLSENEPVVQYFSSKTIHAAREKKAFRRAVIVIALTSLKVLSLLYFGFGDLFETNEAEARVPHFETVAPFVQ
jgi:hypothetical protein